MRERKNALLLSGVLFLCVWLILFITATTSEGAVRYNFGVASVFAALAGLVCSVTWLILDTVDKRRDASGVFRFQYYRLKAQTRKRLERERDEHFSNLAYLMAVEDIEQEFTRDARIMGVDLLTIQEDFSDILGAVK